MEHYRRAMEYAAKAHNGQFRKGTLIPYIVHPFEVVHILTLAEADEETLCVGVLHDVVEDTSVTADDLEQCFGTRIKEEVLLLTENKSLSWEERKQNAIKHIHSGLPKEILLVICADKLSNMRSICQDYEVCREELWKRFKRGREQQQWYYKNMIEALKTLDSYPMYHELTARYDKVFRVNS